MKKNPFLTVMIIPHTEDGPKSLKISVYIVRLLSIALILALMGTYLWLYNYVYISRENGALKIEKSQNLATIEKYTKNYLGLYDDVETLKGKIGEVSNLEEQVRVKSDFNPTTSYFTKANQDVIKKSNTITASNIDGIKDDVKTLEKAIPDKQKSLNELLSLMEDRNEYLLSVPSIWPTVGYITSRFGYRKDPFTGRLTYHNALDIANAYGTPIYATADGIVVFAGWQGEYGNKVVINHGNGIETIYGHNSRLVVRKGQFVKKGQLISYMGSTGRSTGPHCHYEVREHGRVVNPLKYLN